jgi:3',5'-cyclic AMP phosphodiesterase CpdA
MKSLIIYCLLWTCALTSYAKQSPLKFNPNGKFKIVQLTDIHYIYGNPNSDIAIECINKMLDVEKPDLIIVTGDVIYGKPAEQSMRTVMEQIAAKKTPFVILFGNHDDEFGLSRAQLLDIIKTYPYNLTDSVAGLSGVTNGILTIKNHSGEDGVVLYCFDSNAYSGIENVKGYDYIKFDQIAWYKENSAAFTKQNKGKPIPSLAFFHIPFPEYSQAASNERTPLVGTRREAVTSPRLNSGMFTAMKEKGDVIATFVGHDHDNDYAALWEDMLLVYGRYSGANTVYNNLKPNGCRVIELTEGETGFKTWIRLNNAENAVINGINYPSDFKNP